MKPDFLAHCDECDELVEVIDKVNGGLELPTLILACGHKRPQVLEGEGEGENDRRRDRGRV